MGPLSRLHPPGTSARSRHDTSSVPSADTHGGNTNVIYLQGQLKLYAELSKALEQKVEQRNAQIDQLQQKLQNTQTALEQAKEENDDQSRKIQQLEETCMARSSKVSQLVQIIAAKKTSEMQELLLEKSLQITDLTQDRNKLERDNIRLEEELAQAKVTASKFKQDRDKNNKLLLELSDIVRTLNTVAIEYERVDAGDDKSNSSSSSSWPMNQPLRNVKRKIQAMEQDRQRLVQERNELRHDVKAKGAQIAALEASFQLLNDKTRSQSFQENSNAGGDQAFGEGRDHGKPSAAERLMEEQSREVSFEEYTEQSPQDDEQCHEDDGSQSSKDSQHKDEKRKYRDDSHPIAYTNVNESLSIVEEDVSSQSSSSGSSASSFSTLEAPPPPTVPRQEFDDLQRKFDKALDVIERLRDELSKRIRKDSEEKRGGETLFSLEVDKRLHTMERERASLKRELQETLKVKKILESELQDARNEFEHAKRENSSIIQEMRLELEARRQALEKRTQNADAEVSELKNMNEILKQQYNDLETEYTMKIESLQEQVNMAQNEVTQLKQEHQDTVDSLVMEHSRGTEAQRTAYEDLKLEYDTCLEIHLQAEDEAKKVKDLYKEALKKILVLETEVTEVRDRLAMSAVAHQEALAQVKEKKQEAVIKYNKLKQGYELLVESSTKEMSKATNNYEQLQRDYETAVCAHRKQTEELNAKHRELRHDFDNALIEHGKRMQVAESMYEQLKAEYELNRAGHMEKIKNLRAEETHRLSESIESVRRESREEMERVHLESKQLLDQQKTQSQKEIQGILERSREEIERIRADSQQMLEKNNAEFRMKLEQLEKVKEQNEFAAKKEMESLRQEVHRVKAEAMDMLEKQKSDSHATFAKLQADTNGEIDRLTTANKELLECKQEGDDMKVLYRELASSYHSALVKIEALLTSNRANKSNELFNKSKENDQPKCTSGSVMEKIRLLEKQANQATKKKVAVPNRVNSDPTFQRDFNALLERLGYNPEAASNTEAFNSQDDNATCSSMSISLESILAQKDVLSHKAKAMPAIPNMDSPQLPHPELFLTSILCDLLQHFVKLRRVNDAVTKPKQTVGASDIFVPRLEPCHIHNETSVPPDMMSSNAVVMSCHYAEKLQGEKLKNIVYAQTAQIKSQAREKEYRLLELQYKSIKAKFEDAVQSQLVTGVAAKKQPPSSIDLKPSKDDASFQLHLALSSVTSDPTVPPHGVYSDLSEVDCLRKQLLCAELKVKTTRRELDTFQSYMKNIRKHQEIKNQHSVDHFDDLPASESSASATFHNDSREDSLSCTEEMTTEHTSKTSAFQFSHPQLVRYRDSQNAGIISMDDFSGALSATHYRSGPYVQCEPSVTDSIHSVQEELHKAKEEAKLAREKQLEREDNLRDVILQYKLLQKEHEQVTKKLREKQGQPPVSTVENHGEISSTVGSENLYHNLMNEHDAAQVNIQQMQGKITDAQEALRLARENVNGKKDTLNSTDQHAAKRQAIAQYKAVQDEFLSVLKGKKELEKVLYDQNIREGSSSTHQASSIESSMATATATESSKIDVSEKGNDSCSWKYPSKIGSHRGKVHQKVMAFESGAWPLPPSNPNSDVSEITSRQASLSVPQSKKKRFGFRGNKKGFISNLPSLTTLSSSNNSSGAAAKATSRGV